MYKIFHVDFAGHFLGGDAIVVAETQRKAFNSIKKELAKQGLGSDLSMEDVKEIDTTKEQCLILDNGDY